MEAGGASNVLALLEAGIPLVDKQEDLTPFQRLSILKEMERREEQKRERMPAGAGSHGNVNDLRQPNGGGGKGETVTYVNDHDAET